MTTPSKSFTEEELRARLTPEQYRVTQQDGTERPYSNDYHDFKGEGDYHCVVCDAPLFRSESKYDSGTGWPSFTEPVSEDSINNKRDFKMVLPRTENSCSQCGAHLGHVFKDRTSPSGQRFCMNSASLRFVAEGS